MEQSPLQLESYAFDKIELIAQENANHQHHNQVGGEASYGAAQDDPRNWHVILQIDLKASEGETPLYLGQLITEGVFRVHPNWPEDKIEALVTSNAPALLYGAIREMVVNLTSRSKNGPINLKTVRFSPSTTSLLERKDEKKAPTKAQ